MKLLLEEAFKEAENRAILKREFKIASGLDHPNIMPVYVHRQTRKHAYFLMECFGGPNLKQIVRGDPVVIHSRFRKMLECILMAVGHIHEKGWLHRDLKPDNILMTKATDVRLIDFSLSTRIPSAFARLLSPKVRQIQGTRTYISPEVVRRKQPSIQSDIYSLGVTVFECLTGRPPFMGSTPNDLLIKHIQEPPPQPSAFNPNITPEMDKLVHRMLAKKPENRPGSAAELLSEFRSVKIFKEDPEEFARDKAAKDEEKNSFAEESKLDSRADAARSEHRKANPSAEPVAPPPKPQAPPAKQPAAKQPASQPQRPGANPAAQPRQQPAPQPMQPQMMPGYPGAPYMPPGVQQPGWPPGYPPQGMPPQGMPPQGMPQPGMQPPPGQPPRQAQPGQSVPQQPQRPAQPPRPAAQKPAAPAKPPQNPDDDLPFADELPDIA